MNDLSTDLFSGLGPAAPVALDAGVWLLPAFAAARQTDLLAALRSVESRAEFRHLKTPGGLSMSVATTNCGRFGWLSDRRGYRYERCDPLTGQEWPDMPAAFEELAAGAAATAGFAGFAPDACLINRYAPGARMSLHQDRDERDFCWPIVSVSLGLPAVFLLGGASRTAPQRRIPLQHCDVLVWGGAARLNFHGVLPVKAGVHPLLGPHRVNLTFRRAD